MNSTEFCLFHRKIFKAPKILKKFYGKDTIRASGQQRTCTKRRGTTQPACTLLYPYPPRDAPTFLLPPPAPYCSLLLSAACAAAPSLHATTLLPRSSTLCSTSPSLHVRWPHEMLLPPFLPPSVCPLNLLCHRIWGRWQQAQLPPPALSPSQSVTSMHGGGFRRGR
jgi:hypothetical protein